MTAIYVEENSITIDGDLEEAVWNLAEPVAGGLGTGFYAQSPVRSRPVLGPRRSEFSQP